MAFFAINTPTGRLREGLTDPTLNTERAEDFKQFLYGQGKRCTLESFQHFLDSLPERVFLGNSSMDLVSIFFDLADRLTVCDISDARLVAAVISLNSDRKWGKKKALREQIRLCTQPQPDLVNVCHGIDYDILSITSVVSYMEWAFLKLLIRYGIVRVRAEILESEFDSVKDINFWTLLQFSRSVIIKQRRKGTSNNRYVVFGNAVCRNLSFQDYRLLSDEGRRELCRRSTVARVIHVLNYDWHPCLQKKGVKCLVHYFEAVAEPFVAASEIRRLVVKGVFRDQEEYVDESRLKQKLDKYRELFPGIDVDVLQPRTLRHLSRCAVRSSLCERGTLPDVVSKLQLPSKVKDYILIVKLDGESPAVL